MSDSELIYVCVPNDFDITVLFFLFQDDEFVVFPDIRPAAKHHYLIVTREHIRNVKQLTAEHRPVGKWNLMSIEIKFSQASV